jgi:hypothetical protein
MKRPSDSPVGEYRTIVQDSGDPGYVNRLLIGTASTGLVRMEWVASRYGQIIPVNWSMVTVNQFINSFIPLRYQVADAQNLIVREAVGREFEWLFLLEHDTMLPPDGFLQLNEYIKRADTPVVSGLYFTRSHPAEPLIFRGRGTSYYDDWKLGDLVYCDGVPTGALLIHVGLLREMWNDSEEYMCGTQLTRRVFDTPRHQWASPDSDEYHMVTGTSDLDWCTRVIEGDYLRKAGWGGYVDRLEDPRYPFLVDTRLFCKHINPDGVQYPLAEDLEQWKPDPPPTLGVSVSDGLSTEARLV